MKIVQVTENKKRWLPLLLQADESEAQINQYINRGDCYIGCIDQQVIGIAVFTKEEGYIELKNFAIEEKYRGQGFGKQLLRQLLVMYQGEQLRVGTGDNGVNISFYEACGFKVVSRIPNFFVTHYEQLVIDRGRLLIDMIILEQQL